MYVVAVHELLELTNFPGAVIEFIFTCAMNNLDRDSCLSGLGLVSMPAISKSFCTSLYKFSNTQYRFVK